MIEARQKRNYPGL